MGGGGEVEGGGLMAPDVSLLNVYLDWDPSVLKQATRGTDGAGLEVFPLG